MAHDLKVVEVILTVNIATPPVDRGDVIYFEE